jgi:tetratricopeptide (TPR) repeat protein
VGKPKEGEAIELVGDPYGADQPQPVVALGVESRDCCQRRERHGAGKNARHQDRRRRQKADPQKAAPGAILATNSSSMPVSRFEEASGEAAQARRRFAAALKLRPKDPELLFLIARAQARSGDPRAAYTNGSRAIKLLRAANQDPRALEVTMQLGRLLAQRDKWARQRAAELFFEATKPKNAPALPFLELGRVHRMQGDVKRAVWCFRQATERDPNLAEAYLELGRTMKGKREWRKEARIALRRYLKLRPDSKEAPKVRAMLEKLH